MPPSRAGSAGRRPAASAATGGRRGRSAAGSPASISAWSPRSSPSDRMTTAAPRAKAAEARHREEGEQRRADARAAVPVVDRCGGAGQRLVAVADAQCRGDAGQPRAEGEDLGAVRRLARRHARASGSPPCAASSSRRCRSAAAACAGTVWRRRSSGVRDVAVGADDVAQRAAQVELARASGCARCGTSGAAAGRRQACGERRSAVVVVALEIAAARAVRVGGRQFAAFLVLLGLRSRSSRAPPSSLMRVSSSSVAFDHGGRIAPEIGAEQRLELARGDRAGARAWQARPRGCRPSSAGRAASPPA